MATVQEHTPTQPLTRTSHALAAYFVITFAASWLLWLTAATLPASWPIGVRAVLFLPGTVMPAVVALVLTARLDGRAGLDTLVARLLHWRVRARWFMFAFGFMAAVKLTAALAHRALTGAWPAFGDVPFVLLLIAAAASTPVQAGEEIGWRGFALPRLGERLGLARAGVVLGVMWAAWHLPLFFIAGTPNAGQPFMPYLLGVTALSVAFTWLHAHTGASLLPVMVLHAAVNNTTHVVPSAPVEAASGVATVLSLDASPMTWLTVAVLWTAALWFLLRMPAAPVSTAAPTRTATAPATDTAAPGPVHDPYSGEFR
jgi:uncharacterized protein